MIAGLFFSLAPLVCAQEAGGDEAARAALEKLSARFKDVATLTAKVTQVRRTALLDKPITSSGTMSYRRSPARLVFHLAEPRRTEIHIDRSTYQVHRPEEKRLERIDFENDEAMARLLMVFEPKPQELGKTFDIRNGGAKDGQIEIKLDPKDEKVRIHLRSLSLAVVQADGTLKSVAYTDGDGDEMRFDFSDLALNPAVAAGVFELKVPEGTKVLRHTLKKP